MFSYGGRFFSPPQTIIYHLWSRDHRPANRLDSDEVITRKAHLKHISQHKVMKMLINNLLTNDENKYGLGTVRTIEEYEKILNVSFKQSDNQEPIKQIFYSNEIFSNDTNLLAENITNQQTNTTKNRNLNALQLVQSYLVDLNSFNSSS